MKDQAFLGKSYGKWNEVEKPALVLMSYDGLDDDTVEIIWVMIKEYNYYDVVSCSKSKQKQKKLF